MVLVFGPEYIGFWALFGAICAEWYLWYKLRNNEEIPATMTSRRYFFTTIFGFFVAAGIARLYINMDDVVLNEILSFHIGVSAPAVIAAMSGKKPVIQDC